MVIPCQTSSVLSHWRQMALLLTLHIKKSCCQVGEKSTFAISDSDREPIARNGPTQFILQRILESSEPDVYHTSITLSISSQTTERLFKR